MSASVATAKAREAGIELARMLATLAWVMGVAAALLGALGAAPGWLAGEPRAVRRVRSLDDAERLLGARLVLPGFFPSRLAWPPSRVRVAGGRGGAAELLVTDASGVPALVLVQATADGAAIDPGLLGDPTVLDRRRTTVGSLPATLSDVVLEGERWRELRWDLRGRSLVLRMRGELDELYAIARSAHREGPP